MRGNTRTAKMINDGIRRKTIEVKSHQGDRINHSAGGRSEGWKEYPVEPALTHVATRWALRR